MATPIEGLTFFSKIDFQKILDKQKEVLSNVKLKPIEDEAAEVQKKNKAILEIQGVLQEFQASIKSFFEEVDFYKADVSNENAIDVRVGNNAQKGTYYIQVEDVASVQQIVSADVVSSSETVVEEGKTFTIELATDVDKNGTFTISNLKTITINASTNMTIDDLIEAINQKALDDGIPVRASKVKVGDDSYKLLLTTTETGASYKFYKISNNSSSGKFDGYEDGEVDPNDSNKVINVDGSDDNDKYTTVQNSTDAVIKLGDVEITNSSNEFKNLFPSVDITVKEKTDSPVRITIDDNKEGIKEKINRLVEAYNKTIDALDKYDYYDEVTGDTGPLFGDSAISMIRNSLLDIVGSNAVVEENSDLEGFRNIFQVGVYLGTDKRLHIKEYELDYILSTDFDKVKTLFRTNDRWISAKGVKESEVNTASVLDKNGRFAVMIGGMKLTIVADDNYTLPELVRAINEKAEEMAIPIKASMVKVNTGTDYVYKLLLEGTKSGEDYRIEWVESDSGSNYKILDGDATENYDEDDRKLSMVPGYKGLDSSLEVMMKRIDSLLNGQTGIINLIQERYQDELNLLKSRYEKAQKEIDREIERMREEFLRMEKIKAEMLSLQNTLKSYFKVGEEND
jgi:flagellar capping protein FliD